MSYLVHEHTEQDPKVEGLIRRVRNAIALWGFDYQGCVDHFCVDGGVPAADLYLAWHAAKILNKYEE